MKLVTLAGKVTRFAGNGRRLGYPTANITTATTLAEGVYFGHADVAEFRNNRALIFVGVPLTMGDTKRRVEVHLLDIPDVDYYDQDLHVRIAHFHRPNQRFHDAKELVAAMRSDETLGRKWFDAQDPLAKSPQVSDT